MSEGRTVRPKNANEQLAVDFFDALSSGDLERLRPFITEETTWTPMVSGIPGAGAHKGSAIIDEFLAPVRGMFVPGDPKVTLTSLISDGDTVACESSSRGTLSDGRVYDNSYCWVFEMKDGKVHRLREYMDSAYVQRLFGQ